MQHHEITAFETGLHQPRRDLAGTVAVVTGATAGEGLHTARVLAEAGARVIVGTRDPDRAAARLARLPGIRPDTLDLADPVSIDEFARAVLWEYRAVHLLIHAARLAEPAGPTRTPDPTRAQHGRFRLTARLWPALTAQAASPRPAGSRVICLAGPEDADAILFARELDRRGRDHGLRAFSVESRAPRSDPDREPTGAATASWCATTRALDGMGGLHCGTRDVQRAVAVDILDPTLLHPGLRVPGAAARMWSACARETGLDP